MKKLSREEMKNVMGGRMSDPPSESWTCSGSGFGSETYNVSSKHEAEMLAVNSVIAGTIDGSCPANIGPITCSQDYCI